MLAKASTATEAEESALSAGAGDDGAGPALAAGSGAPGFHSISPPMPSSSTITAMSSLRAVRCEPASAASRAFSRLIPSGVSSNTQANTSAGTKPIASTRMRARSTQPGTSKAGSTVSATCTTSQAATR